MERLTERGKNGFVECVFAIPSACTGGNSFIGWRDCTHDCNDCELNRILDRLAQLEDEAEQREKGCDHCVDLGGFCKLDAISIIYNDIVGEPHIIDDIFDYCPKCGRKLWRR